MKPSAPEDRRREADAADLPADATGFRLRGQEMTRTETFTDAAFAFAVTMLVISVDAVPSSVPGLLAALEDVPAFAISFLQLALFWYAHWKWSRRYGMEDLTSVVLSLTLVFVVLVYIFPLRFMFSLLVAWITRGALGDARLGSFAELNHIFLVYGIGFSAMSSVIVLLYHHALRHADALGLDALERLETRGERAVMLILAAVGALSALVSMVAPPTAYGLPGWIYMVIPVAMALHGARFTKRRQALLAADRAGAQPA